MENSKEYVVVGEPLVKYDKLLYFRLIAKDVDSRYVRFAKNRILAKVFDIKEEADNHMNALNVLDVENIWRVEEK